MSRTAIFPLTFSDNPLPYLNKTFLTKQIISIVIKSILWKLYLTGQEGNIIDGQSISSGAEGNKMFEFADMDDFWYFSIGKFIEF